MADPAVTINTLTGRPATDNPRERSARTSVTVL
jgi:hypothetical protein